MIINLQKLTSLLVVSAWLCVGGGVANAADRSCLAESIRGVTLTSWGWDAYGEKSSDNEINYIKRIGANTVILIRPYQVDLERDTIIKQSHGLPTEAHLIHAIGVARSLHLDVVLKLHFIDPTKGDVLGNALYTPHDPEMFFMSYKKTVLENARFAERMHAKIFVLGTEMGGMLTGEKKFQPYFEDIIAAVRKVYHGKITYATQMSTHVDKYNNGWVCMDKKRNGNWCISSDEANYFLFWDKLDYIGIDAYPNLTNLPHPTTDDLISAHYKDIDDFNYVEKLKNIVVKNNNKPLLITEVGTPSVEGAAICVGCWGDGKKADYAVQENIYEATFRVYCKEKENLGLAGMFLYGLEAYANEHTQKYADGINPQSFSFEKKPAEAVVRAYFNPMVQ